MSKRIYIIAEAGVNHNGDLALARALIDAAAQCGADAVKFQTFHAEDLVTRTGAKAEYQQRATGAEESQFDMLKKLELAADEHRLLQAHCRDRGITFLSTPFSESAADFLRELEVERFKIPSGEVTNLPFLRHVAAMGRPVILSTGMADLDEVGQAVAALRGAGCRDLTLLHCVTNYPADPATSNLRAMATMAEAFGVPVGWSDHTPGIEVSLAAAALGARLIEKHLTLDKSLPGPDHSASLDPQEFSALVRGIRTVEAALGDGVKRPTATEIPNMAVVRKSLVARRDIAAGDMIGPGDLIALRPATGLSPALLERVTGRRAAGDIPAGTPILAEMIDGLAD
jgi:N,N'-diacetyllegionaminate synthase